MGIDVLSLKSDSISLSLKQDEWMSIADASRYQVTIFYMGLSNIRFHLKTFPDVNYVIKNIVAHLDSTLEMNTSSLEWNPSKKGVKNQM